jgi:Pyruvate/2-oxoacid:ferredoxin oxidoreductase gamma subunit
MTGGQISGLSSLEFKEQKHAPDHTPPFDVCKLANAAGASFVARVVKPKQFEEVLLQAFSTNGFALVELPSMCQPYGIKKLKDLTQHIGEDLKMINPRIPFEQNGRKTENLFKKEDILHTRYSAEVKGRLGVVIAGSAGGGVQLAARLLTSAAILSGYSATMKGEYPITVGTGFSTAEVILSEKRIRYTGLSDPDVMIILSEDGLAKVRPKMKKSTIVILDSSVNSSNLSSDKVIIQDLVRNADKRGAALMGIAYWLETFGSIKVEALEEAARSHKYGEDLLRIINLSKESQVAV